MRVAGLGLDDRLQSSLQFYFEVECKSDYVFVDRGADFIIADLDGYGAKDLLVKYRNANPDQPIVLLSLKGINNEDNKSIVCLRKPFNMQQLSSALSEITERLRPNQQTILKTEKPDTAAILSGHDKMKQVEAAAKEEEQKRAGLKEPSLANRKNRPSTKVTKPGTVTALSGHDKMKQVEAAAKEEEQKRTEKIKPTFANRKSRPLSKEVKQDTVIAVSAQNRKKQVEAAAKEEKLKRAGKKQPPLVNRKNKPSANVVKRDEKPKSVVKQNISGIRPDNLSDRTKKSSESEQREATKTSRKTSVVERRHYAALSLSKRDMRKLMSTAPDVTADSTQEIAKAEYDPGDFLQGPLMHACKQAKQKKRGVILKARDDSIVIIPERGLAQTKMNENHLRALSSLPMNPDSFSVELLRKKQTTQLNGVLQYSLESLLWKTAVFAARGRVPVGTDLMAPVYLKCWPNLTRLLLFPNALRIAALWVNRPCSLLQAAQVLAIPQRDVFGFYSAAHVLGLTQISDSESFSSKEPVKKPRKRGLLGSILKRLRKN